MKASLDNTIFVNFHDENFKEVGTEQLFNKIGEFFISTEDYLSSEKSLSENEIKKTIRRFCSIHNELGKK